MRKENLNGYIVHLSKSASISMIMTAVDVFCISKKKVARKNRFDGPKIFGNLFGYTTKTKKQKTFFQVDFVNIDLTSWFGPSGLDSYKKSLFKKKEILRREYPGKKHLGTFFINTQQKILLEGDVNSFRNSHLGGVEFGCADELFKKKLLMYLQVVNAKPESLLKFIDNDSSNCLKFEVEDNRFKQPSHVYITAMLLHGTGSETHFTRPGESNLTLESDLINFPFTFLPV